jgi:protein-S-isoprenylcysteine O-methyltransferase Ste14
MRGKKALELCRSVQRDESARFLHAFEHASLRHRGSFWPAVWRFFGLWLIVSLFALVYRSHPYYRTLFFSPFQTVVTNGYAYFCGYGFFYVWATYCWRRRVRDDFSDPALLALSLLRKGWRALRSRSWLPWRRYWRNHRVTLLLRALGVKFFFVPLMVVYVAEHFDKVERLWSQAAGGEAGLAQVNWGLALAYELIFLCDTSVGLIGYSLESLWLGNRTRSVERTWLGWIVCLMCYSPLIDITLLYLPLDNGGNHLRLGEGTLVALRGVNLLFLLGYLWATVALGVRFSNLSNKGIVAHGPYRWVRHPAYLCKNLSWWVERLPTMADFHNVLPLLAWNAIYILRGLTEERHLQADPAYRAYRERVRYRFVPGLW